MSSEVVRWTAVVVCIPFSVSTTYMCTLRLIIPFQAQTPNPYPHHHYTSLRVVHIIRYPHVHNMHRDGGVVALGLTLAIIVLMYTLIVVCEMMSTSSSQVEHVLA